MNFQFRNALNPFLNRKIGIWLEDSKLDKIKLTFWELFKSRNLEFCLNTQISTKGIKSTNNENKLKQGFGNSKRNLNVFGNQAFGFLRLLNKNDFKIQFKI
jgi:hypothetical protein